MKNRYLNQNRILKLEHSKKLRFGWGLGLMIFFGLALGGSFTGETSTEPSTFVLIFIGLAGGGYLLFRSRKLGQQRETAVRYEQCFSADRDGVVTMAELSRATGKDSGIILRELEQLFRQNFFTGCAFQRGENPCVVIYDADVEGQSGFVSVECPHCGGSSRIRIGSQTKCEYCGSPISAK